MEMKQESIEKGNILLGKANIQYRLKITSINQYVD